MTIISVFFCRQTAFVIKDYQFHCFKLRVASSNIWRSIVPNVDLQFSLLHAARCLLLQVSCALYLLIFFFYFSSVMHFSELINFLFQIISAHRKSFTADNYVAIKSCLLSLQKNEITVTSYIRIYGMVLFVVIE